MVMKKVLYKHKKNYTLMQKMYQRFRLANKYFKLQKKDTKK